jgi:hypothetical protein
VTVVNPFHLTIEVAARVVQGFLLTRMRGAVEGARRRVGKEGKRRAVGRKPAEGKAQKEGRSLCPQVVNSPTRYWSNFSAHVENGFVWIGDDVIASADVLAATSS